MQRTLTLWEKTYAILVAEKERTGVPMNRIIHDAVVKYCEERNSHANSERSVGR